ncbi:MAG TPA: hypothetical protein VFC54_07530 [Pseudolabrys sp.]|nr:hypothetical protein [Pseudolabrys sp.]
MSLNRKILLLICTATCAFTVMGPSPSRDLGRIESAAPPYALPEAALTPVDEKADIAALRQQANLALAHLQTGMR